MEAKTDKMDQKNSEEKVDCEPIEETPTGIQEENSLNCETNTTYASNGNKDEDERENKIHAKTVDEKTNHESPSSSSNENKLSNSMEHLDKILKSEDPCDDKKDNLNKLLSDTEKDCNKKQNLDEQQPNASNSESPVAGSTNKSDTQNAANFKKFGSKFKKRNYRSQNSSSDVDDESCNNEEPNNKVQEESSSSDSVEFQPDARDESEDSSDARSEAVEGINNGDSNDWTTASDDDMDELPAVLQKEPSKSDWSIVKDVINRQIGSNYFLPRRFYSSLHVVQRLELMSKLQEHLGCVNSLGFNEKGNLLTSASDDLTITVWDWAIGKKCVSLHTGHRSNVFQSKWLPLDLESFIVTSARDGQVRFIDIRTKATYKLAQHRSACHKISTHLDLPHVVLSAGEDSHVLSIDVRDRKPTKILTVKDNDQEVELYSIHSNPLNNFEFCVAGRMRSVLIYDRRKPMGPFLRQLYPKHLLSDKYAHVTCAVYNHNGSEIIASYNNDDIYLFDVSTSCQDGDFAHKYQGHRNSATVKGVNFFGPNSEFILSGSDCGNIFIWDKKTEAIVQWMPGDEQGIVNALEPHPHIPILATSGLDYDVKIWIPSREETPNIKQKLQSCVKKNLAARTRNAIDAESAFDGHVLWIMLSELRRRHPFTRRILRNQNDDSSDSEIDDNEDDDGDNGDDGEFSDDEDDN